MPLHTKIFLVGLPGAGKTTLGKALAAKKRLDFIDLDEELVNSAKKSIAQIFQEDGETHFRTLEQKCLQQIVSTKDNFVLATGGGTPCFFDNMELMNKVGLTIYVDVPLEVITDRLEKDTNRPLMAIYSLEELYKTRRVFYEEAQKRASNMEQLLLL